MRNTRKRFLKSGLVFSILFLASTAHAADLIQVYHQALVSDQIFQQAVAQRLSTKEGVPISLSALLPSATYTAIPTLSKSNTSGSAAVLVGSNTQRGYTLNLSLNQTIFNFSSFMSVDMARLLSKGADATLNAALQNLMQRVGKAYFAVLFDEDNLRYTLASKKAYAKQLDQVKQQFNAGLKTQTDVYTAQASYSSADADVFAAQIALSNDKENLRVITGVLYNNLSKLSKNFPLVSPTPNNVEEWVATSQRQNWSIKSSQYTADSARQNIKQQFGGNLPTLSAQGGYIIDFNRTISSSLVSNTTPNPQTPQFAPTGNNVAFLGTTQTGTMQGSLTLSVPLVQGGYVVASTQKAQYDYQIAMAQLDQNVRETLNTARQSYSNILSGISKIQADKEAIKSTISSWQGIKAAYQVGTETLVDVVNQQQRVVQALRQYASDRYTYVNNVLALKGAAGTLSVDDLQAINNWLVETSDEDYGNISTDDVTLNNAGKH